MTVLDSENDPRVVGMQDVTQRSGAATTIYTIEHASGRRTAWRVRHDPYDDLRDVWDVIRQGKLIPVNTAVAWP